MGYIKVKYQKILEEMDNNPSLPNGWQNFIEVQKKHHNLIIKSSKNKCFCTNCKHEFISNKKINEITKCPNCKNKYLIKRSNLRFFEFKDYLSILEYINNTFIIRYYELRTTIDANHEHNSSIVEFAREVPTNNYYRDIFVNERVSRCQCHIYINHSSYCNEKKWREYTRNYSLIDYSIVFPNNIKKLLKNTEYKYSYIWELSKHSNYINLVQLLQNKNDIYTVEILTKMKLYNLALQTNKFNHIGSFKETFGVSKDCYPFMKRHNITYTQLKILRLLQEKDINKIRYLEKFVSYGNSTYDLEEISKYISLNRFIKYSKMHHGNIKTYLYKDYLRFAKLLGFDLKNNKYAFPKNLEKEHDRLEKEYKIHNENIINTAIIKRNTILSVNTYKDKQFIIFPVPTLKALLEESKQQHNCVRTYAKKYANGESDIYLMRNIKAKNKSLVTVEVKNNKIVQSRTKYNNSPTAIQIKFLEEWEQNILKGAT